MEKDFWVCWLLGILFESEFADSLVFKGGTSLSKVFGAINRFSEDIDLSLSPSFLGLPETAANRSQADKWREKAGDMIISENVSGDLARTGIEPATQGFSVLCSTD